jgi:hypothetical protein
MNQSPLMKMPMAGEIALLQRIKVFSDDVIREAKDFICDANLFALAQKYEANQKKRNIDIGFNLFVIISDRYHQENLHSDILKALLDPSGKHGEQEKYLRCFLNFIKMHEAKINLSDYKNAQVEREEGRIDILIRDEVSKKAIIIENKINNAGDMPQQLPRYLKQVTDNGYTCAAIIYLRLNGYTGPDTTGWTNEQRKQVNALLKTVCAYDETKKDFLNGWILKCEQASTNLDARHILRQYGGLIKKLGGNIMNKPIMEKFYEIMIKDENLKAALSLKAMVDDLVLYRVEKIIDKFGSDLSPFSQINNYKDFDAYFTGLMWKGAHLGLDICVYPESYLFEFWDRNDREGAKGQARAILQKMGCLNEYTLNEGLFTKKFVFPSQEEDLIQHITAFKNKLREAI